MAGTENDKKVKDLIDDATRADLERWFGLPSFEQLAERGVTPEPPPPEEDPEMVAVRKRRADAIAAVDPAMVEAHRKRTDPPEHLIKFKATIDVRVDPEIGLFDSAMLERQSTIAEPRERELPEELRDDLHDCTPQALLRDLHRPELHYEKTFEIVDVSAEQRFDIVAAVAEAMRTCWTLPPFGPTPLEQARALIRELREDRHRPWTDIKLPNRRGNE
ncbi:MAG TPA: hypothetical protein VFK02_06275 [Kofleriaceae bacterium]|nr:hypothetical protein [Kofleriaceae bacterium]